MPGGSELEMEGAAPPPRPSGLALDEDRSPSHSYSEEFSALEEEEDRDNGRHHMREPLATSARHPPPSAAPGSVGPSATARSAPTSTQKSRGGGQDFLATLAQEITAEEADLRDAVLAFLGAWAERHSTDEGGPAPTMAELGTDEDVRDLQRAALPEDVPLVAWLRQRMKADVVVRGLGGAASISLV